AGKEKKIIGDIVYRLQPKPRLIIKVNDLADFDFNIETFTVSVDNLEFNCRVINRKIRNDEKVDVILSSINDRTIHEKVEKLSYTSFYLMNFPLVLGKAIRGRKNSNFYWKGRLTFGDKKWSITIDKMENYKEIKNKLNSEDGFGITHSGKIIEKQAKRYSSTELKNIINKLYVFLSFARGARSAPIYLKAYNNNQEVLKDWSLHRIDRWSTSQNNWLCEQNSLEQFQNLFPGWSALLDHNLWKKEIPKINYWYCYAGRNV